MAMLQFQLFRAKVVRPSQPVLFDEWAPRDALREAVSSRPSAELRSGYVWHIGNLKEIDLYSAYFAIGRTTKSIVELFDDESGNFVEQEFSEAPYTHVVIDYDLQVCGIARKPRLAPTGAGIARQLGRLLSRTEIANRNELSFDIAPIDDPTEFLEYVRSAFSVTRFAVEFTLPNPWDVEQDFHEPMQRLLQNADGHHGKTELSGKSLNPGTLEELTRSAAASGNDASATLKEDKEAPSVRKRLRGNSVSVEQEDCATEEDRRSLTQRIREAYRRVRNRVE